MNAPKPAAFSPPPPPPRLPLSEMVFEARTSLDQQEAAALRSILHALYDDDSLEDFLDEHASKFVSYSANSEQQLEWTILHNEYVSLMEQQIEEQVGRSGLLTSERLFALLREVGGTDERANAFIARVLSMGDYHAFCRLMDDRAAEAFALQQFKEQALSRQRQMTQLDAQLGME